MTDATRLDAVLASLPEAAIAVSGGVDSLTLAYAAHRRLGDRTTMFHARSPAVPPEATARVERHADRLGCRLEIIDAGEFRDQRYIENPVDRCFYCKSNLYGAIAARTGATILSGANLDDLADYRPGLEAAKHHRVRHPFVEAAIDKRAVRALAAALGLHDVAELPASPCLSSRVETGIRITPAALALVHAVERAVKRAIAPAVVRCRIRQEAIVIELDDTALEAAIAAEGMGLRARIAALAAGRGHAGPIRFARYAMGSAFLGRPT